MRSIMTGYGTLSPFQASAPIVLPSRWRDWTRYNTGFGGPDSAYGGESTAQTYTITQGDHLSGIAQKFGFADFETIWNHGNNQALKNKRKDPHVLYPGDQVFIPDRNVKTVSVPTTKVHRFRTTTKPLLLRIALKDFDDKPIANTACELDVEGKTQKLTTDADGQIQAKIPKTAQKGMLRVPELDMEVPIKIGHLDPVEEDSGWQARLINLGYHAGPVGDTDQERIGYAIEEFQCDHQLAVTGKLDPGTRAKLKDAHGS
jgi:hypothetical protein